MSVRKGKNDLFGRDTGPLGDCLLHLPMLVRRAKTDHVHLHLHPWRTITRQRRKVEDVGVQGAVDARGAMVTCRTPHRVIDANWWRNIDARDAQLQVGGRRMLYGTALRIHKISLDYYGVGCCGCPAFRMRHWCGVSGRHLA